MRTYRLTSDDQIHFVNQGRPIETWYETTVRVVRRQEHVSQEITFALDRNCTGQRNVVKDRIGRKLLVPPIRRTIKTNLRISGQPDVLDASSEQLNRLLH